MSREIRRVPKDWQHPRNERGHYQPLYDKSYKGAAQEWLQNLMDWESDKDGERTRVTTEDDIWYYWDWDGGPPDEDYYRPEWHDEPTHYQIYETVSKGTPTSPVFASLDEMFNWLIAEGYSGAAAGKFVKIGWAPSMVFAPGKGISGIGIHSLDVLAGESGQ